MELFALYGFQRGRRGHTINVIVNGQPVSGCKLISNPAKRQRMMFFAGTVPVQPGDLVELVVKAGVLGLGPDTQRSVHRVYEVVEDAPVIDVSIPGTGVSPYPLLRGALVEKSSTSDYNAIMGEVDELINSIK